MERLAEGDGLAPLIEHNTLTKSLAGRLGQHSKALEIIRVDSGTGFDLYSDQLARGRFQDDVHLPAGGGAKVIQTRFGLALRGLFAEFGHYKVFRHWPQQLQLPEPAGVGLSKQRRGQGGVVEIQLWRLDLDARGAGDYIWARAMTSFEGATDGQEEIAKEDTQGRGGKDLIKEKTRTQVGPRTGRQKRKAKGTHRKEEAHRKARRFIVQAVGPASAARGKEGNVRDGRVDGQGPAEHLRQRILREEPPPAGL